MRAHFSFLTLTFSWVFCLGVITTPSLLYADVWSPFAYISNTMGVSNSHICLGEASRGDIGCPAYAPYVDTAGKVGLRVTSPSATFHVQSNSSDNLPAMLVDAGGDASGEDGLVVKGRHSSLFMGDIIRAEVNRTAGSNFNLIKTVIDADGSPSYPFVVRGDGLVGIGTTSPDAKLTVIDTGNLAHFRNSTTGGDLYISSTEPGLVSILAGTGDVLALGSGGVERMRFLSSGNVGIGTTSPSSTLHVSGTVRATEYCDFNGANCTSIPSGGSSVWSESSGNVYRTSGSVGIGTANPTSSLSIYSTTPQIRLTNTATGADNFLNASSTVGGLTLSADEHNEVTGSYLGLRVDGNWAMFAKEGGFVGIGNDTPNATLDVVGKVSSTAVQLANNPTEPCTTATIGTIRVVNGQPQICR